MTVVVTRAAARDLDATLERLHRDRPTAAVALRTELFRVLAVLDAGGLDGAPCTLRSGAVCRRFFVHPWWVYYRRAPMGVLTVVRLGHHARRPLTARDE